MLYYNKWNVGLAALCSGAVIGVTLLYWHFFRKSKKGEFDEYVSSDRLDYDDDQEDGPIHHIQPIDEIESSLDITEDDLSQRDKFSCVGDTYTNNIDDPSKQPCEDEDDSHDMQKENRKILILGLDRSGKSSLLSHLSKENRDCRKYLPTQGFNVVCVSFESIDLGLWEIGGSQDYRHYWKNFAADVDLVLFLCDSEDHERIGEAKVFLNNIMEELDVGVDIQVVATKCDLSNAMSSHEIQEKLGITDTDIRVLRMSVKNGGAERDFGIEEIQNLCVNL